MLSCVYVGALQEPVLCPYRTKQQVYLGHPSFFLHHLVIKKHHVSSKTLWLKTYRSLPDILLFSWWPNRALGSDMFHLPLHSSFWCSFQATPASQRFLLLSKAVISLLSAVLVSCMSREVPCPTSHQHCRSPRKMSPCTWCHQELNTNKKVILL